MDEQGRSVSGGMRTTYVLGAGASKHAGYPLSSQLWQNLVLWADHKRPESRRVLETVLALAGPVNDLEGTLTEMDVGSGVFGTLSEDQREGLITGIRSAIVAYFAQIRKAGSPAPYYAALAKHVAADDAIVTFNYDVALDQALISEGKFRVRGGYGIPVDWDEEKSPLRVLKLHGSVNWCAFGPGGYTAFEPGAVLRLCVDNRDIVFANYPSNLLDRSCGPGYAISDLLILPTREKRFYIPASSGKELEGHYDSLWTQAADSLERCDRIVLIGYRMPNADRRARGLLLWGTNKLAEVIVCCGSSSASVAGEFESHGFLRVSQGAGFADYLREHAPGAMA